MAATAQVAISSEFLTAFAVLPKKIQAKVTDFINKFKNNPKSPGINYEKLKNGIDDKICSVRIDDTYRGIVARQAEENIYLLLWVAHHDKAYAWGEKKRCEVNPQSGTLQVYEVQELAPVVKTVPGFFAKITDEELLKMAVPEALLPLTRSFTGKEAFFAAKEQYPQDAYEALSWIVEDVPACEAIELIEDNKTQKATSMAEALTMPETLKSFVVVEGEEELRRIMSAPLEKWRVFLHPAQRKLVAKNFSGAARVLGGAGTGKTVVAMHRAKYLAKKTKEKGSILFTTFTANLAADIQENLRQLCDVEEMKCFDILNLDQWLTKYLKSEGYNARIIFSDKEIKELWELALSEADAALTFGYEFFEEEWRRVVLPQEALSKVAYMKATRTGRGTRLDRSKRIEVWKVMEAYLNLMKERGVRDVNYAYYECASLLRNKKQGGLYKHVIVDEGQDLSDSGLRLVRAIAGEEHANDIFIVGDSHQRIYKNRAVLSKCGINVRGRSSILKINYRTTEEIRKAALAVLQGLPFDDLDGETLDDNCQSLTHGSQPCINRFKTAEEEMDFLVKEIKGLEAGGVALADICLAARTHGLLDKYKQGLVESGLDVVEITANKSDNRNVPGVRIATMHRVKGLEFPYVFIAAVNDGVLPLSLALTGADKVSVEENMTAEKSLLYVAMTRAKKAVYLSCYGKASEFLG